MSIPREGSYGYDIIRGNVPSSGNLSLRHRSPDKGERIVYLSVAVENKTTTDGDARIGVSDANYFYIRSFHPTLTVNIPQTYDNVISVVKDDTRLEVQIIGATSGDLIEVTVHYVVERDKETE